VWCGPKESLKLTRPGLSHQTDGVTEIDDVTAIKHFEAVFISETKIVHASGAGDAFCAGVVNAMLRDECRELDSVCIEEGLRVARAFLESDINSK
jgi:sugar/nucleoside kinase (ribokinase family)